MALFSNRKSRHHAAAAMTRLDLKKAATAKEERTCT
jgi:hypothetical protein